jgi:hypothetical protein
VAHNLGCEILAGYLYCYAPLYSFSCSTCTPVSL